MVLRNDIYARWRPGLAPGDAKAALSMNSFGTSAGKKAVTAIALVAGLLVYIVGCLSWILAPLIYLTGNKWMTLSSAGWLKVALYLLALPVGIALLCIAVQGFHKARLAASLLVPVPIILVGVAATPGNASPGMLIVSGLVAALAVVALLRKWARRPTSLPSRPLGHAGQRLH